MKEKLMRFMYGRYGVDSFGKFTVITAIVCAFLATFTNVWIFSLLAWVLLFYTYFRIFSRNFLRQALAARRPQLTANLYMIPSDKQFVKTFLSGSSVFYFKTRNSLPDFSSASQALD